MNQANKASSREVAVLRTLVVLLLGIVIGNFLAIRTPVAHADDAGPTELHLIRVATQDIAQTLKDQIPKQTQEISKINQEISKLKK